MKRLFVLLYVVCCIVWINIGCGRKGDPIVPVIPYPLPVQDISASINHDGITLSWAPPTAYDTEKPMELSDIKTFTIFRKAEPLATSRWDFSETAEGWSAKGKTSPIKWHKGILRTASSQKSLLITSPADLSIEAQEARYIRLRLWAKNSAEGYIAFITDEDKNWDIEIEQKFQPAVHTSFYSYQNVFSLLKLKPFQIHPDSRVAHEYIIDMKRVPSWKGTINQIGIILRKRDASALSTPVEQEEEVVELGLENVEFTNTLKERAPIYEKSPWLFLEDEEGWNVKPIGTVFGATEGILYARGSDALILMSQAGQNIELGNIHQLYVRMKVTDGDTAYLVFRKDQEDAFSLLYPSAAEEVLNRIRIPLKDNNNFHSYTINMREILARQENTALPESTDDDTGVVPEEQPKRPEKEMISQLGLMFPALEQGTVRHILIDTLWVAESGADAEQLSSTLDQDNIVSVDELAQQIQQKRFESDPEFHIAYPDLPFEKVQPSDEQIKLAEISPQKPHPAIIKDGKFYLTDTGKFSANSTDDATLTYGIRYTYQIELTDRKKQTSKLPGKVTVNFTRPPTAPSLLKAKPGDKEITLTWNRPFLSKDGKKLRFLAGYNIFRSLESGKYPEFPIHRALSDETTFTDKQLTNGVTYYYTIQSATSLITTQPAIVTELASEVSATPSDNIPPNVPTGLVGVYMGNTVSIYWNLTEAKDVAGFNLYRSETPEGEFRKINTNPILQGSYVDTTIEANKVYYYYVTAFDDATPPNESQASEVALVETFIKF